MPAPALIFRFDTNSPYAWLAAERIDALLGPGVVWEPIAFAFLLAAQGREPWSFHEPAVSTGKAECERRAAERGLPPMVWPPGWPRASWTVEGPRAVMAARAFGREREVALALFRRNFVTGEGLTEPGAVEACWARAGLDPAAYDEALAAAKAPLREATDRAIALGVPGVPTVSLGDRHWWGDDRLEVVHAELRAEA